MTGARDKRERVRGAVAEDVDDNTRGMDGLSVPPIVRQSS